MTNKTSSKTTRFRTTVAFDPAEKRPSVIVTDGDELPRAHEGVLYVQKSSETLVAFPMSHILFYEVEKYEVEQDEDKEVSRDG